MRAETVIHNVGQLVTCASNGRPRRGAEMRGVGLIENGAVAIADGKFIGVGTSDEIYRNFDSDNVVDAQGRVVCPGFVDPHTHIVFAGNRLDEFELKIKGADYLEILKNGGGIISTVRKTRDASADKLFEQTLARLDKMLACGTTACEVKTGYGLDTETELKMLDVIEELDKTHPIDIVPTFLAAHAVPPEYKDDAEAYVDLICGDMLPKAWDWYCASQFCGKGTAFFADVFCEKNAFSTAQTERVLRTAKALWFGLKVHVDQFTNLGGTKMAVEMGAASVDHLDAISNEEVKLLAGSDTVGIVIPTENFSAGKTTYAPARRMIDAGCIIALSTDYNPGSAPCPSQTMTMAIACRYQKLLPAEAFNAATINAAFGIGLGETHGSVEVGKQADLVILNTADYRECAYEFGGNLVNKTIKRGKIVYDAG